MKKKLCNGLDKIVSQAVDELKEIQGGDFDLNKINLSELERRTVKTGIFLTHLAVKSDPIKRQFRNLTLLRSVVSLAGMAKAGIC